ncbi:MAG: hypothetical protein QM674_06845 [Burkholderiaceae bacterium]
MCFDRGHVRAARPPSPSRRYLRGIDHRIDPVLQSLERTGALLRCREPMRPSTRVPHSKRDASVALHAWLDALLYGFSTHAVPVVLAIVSVIALVSWDDHYAAPNASELSFRALPVTAQETLSPRQAAERLRDVTPVRHLDSRMVTTPFWVAVPIGHPEPAPRAPGHPALVDFPSRHTTELICWNGASFEWLGRATRDAAAGALRRGKAGFVIDLADIGPGSRIWWFEG